MTQNSSFVLKIPKQDGTVNIPADGEAAFLNKLKARTTILPWDDITRFSAKKTILPDELWAPGISLTSMTELVDDTIDDLKSRVSSETFVMILSCGTIHKESEKDYQLLYYTGAFDDFHGWDGVSYKPIPVATIRHTFKELLKHCLKTVIDTADNMCGKLERNKKSAAKDDCIASWSKLSAMAFALYKAIGTRAEIVSCIKKISDNPKHLLPSSAFNAMSSRYMFCANNCVVYVGCEPPFACPGHPSDLMVGGEQTDYLPSASPVNAVEVLLNGLTEYSREVRDYMECQLAECLLTVDLTKKTAVFISRGNTGKTRLLDLLRDMSGPVGRILAGNREFFLGCRKSHISDLKLMRHKTGLLCEEMGSERSPINSDIYKLMSGGFSKSIEIKNYQDTITTTPKVIITCNDPKFTQFGDAEERRTVFFNSKYVFVLNPDPNNPHQKQADHTLGDQLREPAALEYMLSILANAASRAVCHANCRKMPKEVQKSSDVISKTLRRNQKLPDIKVNCDWEGYMQEVDEENLPLEDCAKLSFEELRQQCLESWRDRAFDAINAKIEDWLIKGSRSDRAHLSKYLKKDSKRRLPKKSGKVKYKFPKRKRRWGLDVNDEEAPGMELVLIENKKIKREITS